MRATELIEGREYRVTHHNARHTGYRARLRAKGGSGYHTFEVPEPGSEDSDVRRLLTFRVKSRDVAHEWSERDTERQQKAREISAVQRELQARLDAIFGDIPEEAVGSSFTRKVAVVQLNKWDGTPRLTFTGQEAVARVLDALDAARRQPTLPVGAGETLDRAEDVS